MPASSLSTVNVSPTGRIATSRRCFETSRRCFETSIPTQFIPIFSLRKCDVRLALSLAGYGLDRPRHSFEFQSSVCGDLKLSSIFEIYVRPICHKIKHTSVRFLTFGVVTPVLKRLCG